MADDYEVDSGDFGGAFDDFTEERDDSGGSSGGSDSNDGGDSTPEPTQNQDQLLDGSAGGGDDNPFGGDDDEPSVPDEPSTETDNPFDDGGGSDVPAGNTPSSGNLPSQGGDSTGDGFADPQGGSEGGFDSSNPQGSGGETPAPEGPGGDDRAQGGGREFVEDDPGNIPDDPLLSRDTRSGIRGTANDVANTLLGTEGPDEDIQGQLTEGRGLVSDEEQRRIAQRSQRLRDRFDFGDQAGSAVEDVTGSETLGDVATGAGRVPGEISAGAASLPILADTTVEAAANFGETASEEGVVQTSETVANTVSSGVRAQVDELRQNPAEQSGLLLGEIAAGTAATRGASGATQRVSNARTRAAADETVDFEDITSERGAQGESPTFDTDPNADTDQAVQEIEQRAADQPDAVQENVGTDQVLFRSETDRLPSDVEAQEGQFELAGLFTSPDASPLRTDIGDGSSISDVSPRLPRPSDFTPRTQRLSAFEGDRVEGMPDDAAGSGITTNAQGERIPDPDAAGNQFLRSEQAEEGTAFVRARGDRTTELEAIFPEGSEFERSSTMAVDLPNNEVATMDVFERRGGSVADEDVAAVNRDIDADAPAAGRSGTAGDADVQNTQRDIDQDLNDGPERIFREEDIRDLERRGRDTPDGQPVTPPIPGVDSTTPQPTDPADSTGIDPTSFAEPTVPSDPTTPSPPDSPGDSGGPGSGGGPGGSNGPSGPSGGGSSTPGSPGSPGSPSGGGSGGSGTPGPPGDPGNPGRRPDRGGDSADEDEDPFVPVDLTGVQSIDAQVETRDVYVDPFEDNG